MIATTISGQYLRDSNNDDILDTSEPTCTQIGVYKTDDRCILSNEFVSGCSTYDQASLCSACEAGNKLVSLRSDTLNNLCISCAAKCPCGASCSSC